MSAVNQDYVKWFRQSSPYINAYRGKTFVLMLPGAAIEHGNFANIIHDIGLLNSLGVHLVLVHGARPQIDRCLAAENIASQFHKNLRITDQDSISRIARVIGEVRVNIEAQLSTGLPNSPMHGARIRVVGGNFVTARPCGIIDGLDFLHTGKVRRVDGKGLSHALSQGCVILLSPLGYSPTGEIFNLSYAEIATQAAVNLKADKLIAFTPEQGVRNRNGRLMRELTLKQCGNLLSDPGRVPGEVTLQALQSCYNVCSQGIPRAQMISYSDDGALIKELFTRDGTGTMVYCDSYEVIRRGRIDDVGGIIKLISAQEKLGVLVRRSRELLETEVDQFTVMEKDGMIIACAALYPYPDNHSGELACVVTHEDYRSGGRAAKLLTHIERQAHKLRLKTLFTLTTQTAHWFLEQGFTGGDLSNLPDQKQSLYNYRRNSKVFIKQL